MTFRLFLQYIDGLFLPISVVIHFCLPVRITFSLYTLLTGSRNLAIHVTQLIFRSHIPDAEYHKIVVGIEELNRYKL